MRISPRWRPIAKPREWLISVTSTPASWRKFAAAAEQKLGYAPKAEDRFPSCPGSERRRRHHDRDSRPLAYADGGARPQSRKARLRRKTFQPESARGRTACCRAEEIWKARSGWRSAAVFRLHHPHDQADSRRPHRRRIHGEVVVRQHARLHGNRKAAPVPASLNWDLWQGPAPRSEYKDNIHPYNWHWLRRYGTGETLKTARTRLTSAAGLCKPRFLMP